MVSQRDLQGGGATALDNEGERLSMPRYYCNIEKKKCQVTAAEKSAQCRALFDKRRFFFYNARRVVPRMISPQAGTPFVKAHRTRKAKCATLSIDRSSVTV
jgi:hypothetical protein